ncbi:unnamed protein product, partial [Timema podura]|nr:unnamed protein product [Timema podura]
MLCPRRLNINWITRNIKPLSISFYSKRSSSKNSDTVYKIVKVRDGVNDFDDSAAFGPSPNWELLGPPGYRFYMPGNVGPAWQNASTTVQLDDLRVSFKYE